MDDHLRQETLNLMRAWLHEPRALRDYLVQDVEDPRINVQSILTRHWLLERVCPGRFAALMFAELRFAAVMNWLLPLRRDPDRTARYDEILSALLAAAERDGEAPGAGEMDIPPYLIEAFGAKSHEIDGIAIPDFVTDVLLHAPDEPQDPSVTGHGAIDTFAALWRCVLDVKSSPAVETSSRPTVLEPACGSANDYRFLDAFGIAPRLDYTGFDLSDGNIDNAQAMFPGVRFEVGNVFEIAATDRSYDYCYVHDLFEHLSPAALERALAEICRVTRDRLCLHFFNMHTGGEHQVRPVRHYHWNRLSLPRVVSLLESQGGTVRAVHVDELLRARCNCPDTHNKNAYTLYVSLAHSAHRVAGNPDAGPSTPCNCADTGAISREQSGAGAGEQ